MFQTLNLVCGPPLSGLMPRVSHRKLSSRASWAPCGPGPSSPSCAPAGPDTLPSRAPAQSLRTSLLLPFSWASAENSFCFTVGFLSTLLFILIQSTGQLETMHLCVCISPRVGAPSCCRNQYLRNQAPHSESWRTQVYYAGGLKGVNTLSSEPRTKGLQSFYT